VAESKGRPVELYDGPLLSYPHGSLAPSDALVLPESKPRSAAPALPAGPVTYLSYVDGKLERHGAWKDCEARVKGRGGAKFKKVRGPDEESATLRAWGLS
jgi:hypothetical protein